MCLLGSSGGGCVSAWMSSSCWGRSGYLRNSHVSLSELSSAEKGFEGADGLAGSEAAGAFSGA